MAEKEDMTEQQYLELANQLKESFDEKDKQVERLLKENEEIKKDFLSLYGMIRVLNYYADGNVDEPILTLIESARGFASSIIDDI
jgi:predicted nucleotide-binding protein (sugar kinase/HSP70/actin superfamily)